MIIWRTVLLTFFFFTLIKCRVYCEHCRDGVCGLIDNNMIKIGNERAEIHKEPMSLLNSSTALTCMISGEFFFVKYNECRYIKFDVIKDKARYGVMPHDDNADTPICLNEQFGTIEFVYSNGSVAAYGPSDKLVYSFIGVPSCQTPKSKKNKNCRTTRATPREDKDEKPEMKNPKPNESNEVSSERKSDFAIYHLLYCVVISILCFIIVILACNCISSKRHCCQHRLDTVGNTEHEHNHTSPNNDSRFTSKSALIGDPKSESKSSLFNPEFVHKNPSN